jgi:hypothetical protein
MMSDKPKQAYDAARPSQTSVFRNFSLVLEETGRGPTSGAPLIPNAIYPRRASGA